MNDVLFLAWRYLRFNWIKSLVLLASISLVLFLPLGLQVVVQQGADTLTSRAAATPLLIGAKGSAVDLALSALYFREPIVKEGKLGGLRWLSMWIGLVGSYKKHETVDVEYGLRGRTHLASDLEVSD